jgi:hypothetical protein
VQGSLRDGTPVIVSSGSTKLERVDLTTSIGAYDEAWLQKLLSDHPECLPIGEIEPGFEKLVAISRELPTRHGSIDNLFMTGAGDIVMVEAKLWRNSQARREVIGQAVRTRPRNATPRPSCWSHHDFASIGQGVPKTRLSRCRRYFLRARSKSILLSRRAQWIHHARSRAWSRSGFLRM